ncbi:MAG: hypothetical protein IT377_12450 [Polyangiaceae bacterium]|nr:hypothetical protein [Polyangiaceae bacterium]
MASKFQQFLTDNKLDSRRLLNTSKILEGLQREDRSARLAKRRGAKAETKPAEGAEKPPKRRSGRPVTPRLLSQALEGKPVSGPAKTRLLRAVNRLLEQKKKDPADLRKLF